MDINQDLDGIADSATRVSLPEEATSNFIGDVTTSEEEVNFVTGSSYKGSWDALGMTGVGRYVMPNGTVYEGEMRDGMFHGHGSLYWSNNQRLDVVHVQGKLQEYKYTFADGLSYEDEDWSYCRFPDRRFYESRQKGLRPGGRTLRSAKQPTKIVPAGCYDAGDGVFDPKTLCVTSYDDSNKILRITTQQECDWIVKNCRKSWTEPTGYRSSLNENWSEDPPELPYNLAMSEDSPDLWWKRLTKFERDLTYIGEEPKDDGLLEMPELCFCGQYVSLGEPCQCPPVPVTSRIEWKDHLDDRGFYGKHEDEEMEGEDIPFDPALGPFADTHSAYVFGERDIEEIEGFAVDGVSEEIPQILSPEKFVETYRTSEENVKDEVDIDQLLLEAAKLLPEIENGETRDKENLQTDAEEKLEEIASPIDKVEEEIVRQSSKVDNDGTTEQSEDSAKNDIPQESIVENQESIERSGGSINEEKLGKSLNEADQDMIEGREIAGEEEVTTQDPEAMKKLENQDERSTYSVEDQGILKSEEEIDNNVNSQTEDLANNEVQLQDVPAKSSEEFLENGRQIILKNENEREAESQDHEAEISSEVAIKQSSLTDSSDQRHKHYVEEPGNVEGNAAENSINEDNDVPAISHEDRVENHDYVTAATVPREKVSGATEPETTDERRSETKLLPKATETGSIEEAGQDLHSHRVDTEAIISDDVIATETSVKLEENGKPGATETATAAIFSDELDKDEQLQDDDQIVAEISMKLKGDIKSQSGASETKIFSEELVKDELEDHAEDDKRPKDKVDRQNEPKIDNEIPKEKSTEKYVAVFEKDKISDKASKSQLAEENKKISGADSKTSVKSRSKKSSKASKISVQPSQDSATKKAKVLETDIADTSGSKLGEELSQKSELMSDSQTSSRRVVTGIRETVSTAVKTEEKSLDSLKTKQISLEKVHPSLASLPPEEQKLSEHEEIIEIYKKVPKKEKLKKKCSTTNVWRLSSTLREYSAQGKMPCQSCGLRQITSTDDLRSGGAALTAPRSRPVEYGRKPCDSQFRKLTTQEVPVMVLPCREEYPFKIQAKPDRLTGKYSCRNIRGKK